jgi:hypothetical protein
MRFICAFLSFLILMQAMIFSINLFADEDGRVWRDIHEERWMAKEMHAGNNYEFELAGEGESLYAKVILHSFPNGIKFSIKLDKN